MGILSNLFKLKTSEDRIVRRNPRRMFSAYPSPDASQTAVDEDTSSRAEEEEQDQPLRSISFGGSRGPVKPAPVAVAPRKKSAVPPADTEIKRVPVSGTAVIPDMQIVIELSELLPQIPEQYLKADKQAAGKKELRFNSYDLLPSLSRGKATATLSRIIDLAPELFSDQHPGEDMEIALPLQKIVRQIGAFPGRPDQMEEQYPPLDPKYENLVVETDAPAPPVPVQKAPETKIESAVDVEPSAPVRPPDAPPSPVVIAETPVFAEKNPAAGKTVDHPHRAEPAEVQQPEPLVEEEKVSYSLAALLPNLPKSWLLGELKPVDESARITVPFHLIESQLASGKVELAFHDFLPALPEDLKSLFSNGNDEAKTARIPIPLSEVFLNLPGVEPLPPPKPVADEMEKPAGPDSHVGAVIIQESGKSEQTTPAAIVPEKTEDIVPVTDGQLPLEEAKTAETPAGNEHKDEQSAQADETTKPAPVSVVSDQSSLVVTPTAETSTPENLSAPIKMEAARETATVPSVHAAAEASKQPVPGEQPATGAPAQDPPPVTGVTEQHAGKSVEDTPAIIPPEPTAPASPIYYPDPHQSPEHVPVTLAPPRIQLQPMHFVPPPVLTKAIPPPTLGVSVPKSESESEKALAFASTSPAFQAAAVNEPFTTDGKPDPAKSAAFVAQLPGVKAVDLSIGNETKSAGEVPQDFNMHDIGKAAALLLQSLEIQNPEAAGVRNITLHHDAFSSTWFKRGAVLLGILHPQRSIESGLHDQLMLVTDQIARQH